MPVACPMRQTAKGNGGHSRIPPHAADLRIDRSRRPPTSLSGQVVEQRQIDIAPYPDEDRITPSAPVKQRLTA